MTTTNPRVSIGLPVFNGENYLENTLQSILSQTYADFQLIISDNASTDQTQEICVRYSKLDPRIQYYRNTTNIGAAKNYNQFVNLALGTYFKWIAHDDPIAPTYLERCVSILDTHPEFVMCYPRTILIDDTGDEIEKHFDGFDLRSPRPHERLKQSLRSSAWCHPVFGLTRKDMLVQTGLFGNYASSDKVLLAEFAVIGKCFEVPEHLSYRRLHPQNSTQANKTDEEMAAWFDPLSRKKVFTPRFRRFIEINKAINRTQMKILDRFLCYLELYKFYVSGDRIAGLGRDLRQLSSRLFR